jgi:hypothetical protein
MKTGSYCCSEAGELQAMGIAAGTREIPRSSRLNPRLPADIDSILHFGANSI